MARLHTEDQPGTEPEVTTPRGDEALDDWFARRLEAQGIGHQRRRLPMSRVLSVLGLAAGVIAVGLVLVGLFAGGGSGHKTASPPHTRPTSTGTSPTTKQKTAKPAWQRIRLTVLNGFGGSGAATDVASQLTGEGFNVVAKGNGGTDTSSSYIAYAPGYQVGAQIIADRLSLPAPVPLADAAGVTPTTSMGVVLVLGSNLVPAT